MNRIQFLKTAALALLAPFIPSLRQRRDDTADYMLPLRVIAPDRAARAEGQTINFREAYGHGHLTQHCMSIIVSRELPLTRDRLMAKIAEFTNRFDTPPVRLSLHVETALGMCAFQRQPRSDVFTITDVSGMRVTVYNSGKTVGRNRTAFLTA